MAKKAKSASTPKPKKKAASAAKKSRSKSKQKKVAAASDVSAVAVEVTASAPVVEKLASASAASGAASATSAASAASAADTSSKSVVASVEDTSSALFDRLIDTLQSRIASDRQLLKEVRALKKAVSSERRQYQKFVTKYNKRRSGNRRNGFQVPTPISTQMAKFVGVPNGSEMARTEVTKFIHTYIKDKKLQNPDNGQEIFPDSKLKKLLYSGDSKITYFKLQTFLKPHFLKRDKATGEVAQFVAPTSA